MKIFTVLFILISIIFLLPNSAQSAILSIFAWFLAVSFLIATPVIFYDFTDKIGKKLNDALK
nr:MAG TPA: hypothetical protein [Caudoviricetes sp.]